MNIFVGKLNYATSEDDLRQAFEAYGAVSSCKIIMDRFTGRSKGFAFVEMPDSTEAKEAIEGLNNIAIGRKTLVVKEAEERSGGFNSNSGGFRRNNNQNRGFGGNRNFNDRNRRRF